MPSILLTAFGPYDQWTENASWLAMQQFLCDLPAGFDITTRLYPVDFDQLRERLASDLANNYDIALHLGQAPGNGAIELESIGLNVARLRDQLPDDAAPLAPDGPPAYQSRLPLSEWAALLRSAGIPARVSHHAGTYLCNAALYLSHYLIEQEGYHTAAGFLHLPLDTSQVIGTTGNAASLPSSESARALRLIVDHVGAVFATSGVPEGRNT